MKLWFRIQSICIYKLHWPVAKAVLDVRVLKTYDIVVHVRRMVVTSTGVRVSMAVGGTAAVDWVRLRAGVFTGHTAAAVMVSRGH